MARFGAGALFTILTLEVVPEASWNPEDELKLNSRLRRDRRLALDDLVDRLERTVHPAGQFGLGHVTFLESLQENLARRNCPLRSPTGLRSINRHGNPRSPKF